MIPAITPWLLYTIALCGLAWLVILAYGATHKGVWALGALVAASVASLPGALLPLSHAAPWSPPPGNYQLMAARVDIDEAIWILVAGKDGEPRLYRLPYTTSKANELQEALDAITIGGTGTVTVGQNGGPGGVAYKGEAPDQGNVGPKVIEQPLVVPAPTVPNNQE